LKPKAPLSPLLTPIGEWEVASIPEPIEHWVRSINDYHLDLEKDIRRLRLYSAILMYALLVLVAVIGLRGATLRPSIAAILRIAPGNQVTHPMLTIDVVVLCLAGATFLGMLLINHIAWRLKTSLWYARASLWELIMLFKTNPYEALAPKEPQ
jgi:hypothetical protein